MKLGNFLASGKSLVGFKHQAGRYQLPQGRVLPKFSSDRPATAPPPPCQAMPSARTADVNSGGKSPTSAMTVVPGKPDGERTLVQERSGSGFWRNVVAKLSSWGFSSGQKRTRGIPVFSKLPVQTELSLDKVKVVRNDLTEGDLEVVSGRTSNPAPKREPDACGEAPRDREKNPIAVDT